MEQKVMDRIKTALGDDKALAVLASLYGPLARRVQGLEDALVYFATTVLNALDPDDDEVRMLSLLGFRVVTDETDPDFKQIVKTHEPQEAPSVPDQDPS